MTQTHSPGPWTYDAESCVVFSAGHEWPIADAWWRPEGPDKLTAEANARLMAAAPEMYEALVLLAEAASEGCDPAECARCREGYDKTRAVLAKARGE